jgi:hypothetical protein
MPLTKKCSVAGGATLQERGNAAYVREAYMNSTNKDDLILVSNRSNKSSFGPLIDCLNAVVHDKNSQHYRSRKSQRCNDLLSATSIREINSVMEEQEPRYRKVADYVEAPSGSASSASPLPQPVVSPRPFGQVLYPIVSALAKPAPIRTGAPSLQLSSASPSLPIQLGSSAWAKRPNLSGGRKMKKLPVRTSPLRQSVRRKSRKSPKASSPRRLRRKRRSNR